MAPGHISEVGRDQKRVRLDAKAVVPRVSLYCEIPQSQEGQQ